MALLVCSICRDSLSLNQIEVNESRIVAVECGHVFHRSCLSQWVELGSRCPCCRRNVTVSKFLSLYPTSSDVSSADNSRTEEINFELNETLSKLKKENQLCFLKNEELLQRLKFVEDANEKLKASCQVWIKRSEELNNYKVINNNLQAKCDTLETTLKHFHSAENIINGESTHHVIESTNECCMKSSESLFCVNQILSKELQDAKHHIKQLEAKLQKTRTLYLDAKVKLQE